MAHYSTVASFPKRMQSGILVRSGQRPLVTIFPSVGILHGLGSPRSCSGALRRLGSLSCCVPFGSQSMVTASGLMDSDIEDCECSPFARLREAIRAAHGSMAAVAVN